MLDMETFWKKFSRPTPRSDEPEETEEEPDEDDAEWDDLYEDEDE